MRRYYEFALVITIISILAIVLLQSLQRVKGNMEEANVQSEAAAIRAQLIEVLAHREVFGGSLPKSDNPLDWVSNRPASYLGVRDVTPKETAVWYFDANAGELIYLFQDGHAARFRLSRAAGSTESRGVLAGVGLLRLPDKTN